MELRKVNLFNKFFYDLLFFIESLNIFLARAMCYSANWFHIQGLVWTLFAWVVIGVFCRHVCQAFSNIIDLGICSHSGCSSENWRSNWHWLLLLLLHLIQHVLVRNQIWTHLKWVWTYWSTVSAH